MNFRTTLLLPMAATASAAAVMHMQIAQIEGLL
jgi:hypothetical protein